jgi:hypothetical protein
MSFEIYTTRDLLGVLRDESLDNVSNFWRQNFFPTSMQSTREEIVFEKITGRRRVAPFVRPTSVGQPLYTRKGSQVDSFRPAYLKPKDAVRPVDQLVRMPGDLFTDTPMTPEQNYDAEVGNIMDYHRTTIERRWEVMAALAAINGTLDVEYSDGSTVELDFQRAANLTVIKNANYWDASYDIIDDVQEWIDRMTAAEFGGIPDTMLVGTDVWKIMRKNTKLKELMDLNFRRSDVDMSRGLLLQTSRENRIRYAGRLNESIDVWVYNDFYQDASGAQVNILNPKEIVLLDSNFEGVMAFGAILDADAQLAALPMFPKMWRENDPSATYVMTQSAPLAIPVYPNRSFRARVLAT